MRCSNCGTELRQGAMFCPNCGSRICSTSTTEKEIVPKMAKKMQISANEAIEKAVDTAKSVAGKIKKEIQNHKAVFASLYAVVMVAVIILTCLAFYFNTPNQRIIRALKSGDNAEAVSIFYDNIDTTSEKESLTKNLEKFLVNLKDDFDAGEIDYHETKSKLNTILTFNLEDLSLKIAEMLDYIDNSNEACVSFEDAERADNNGDYEKAIELYKSVPQNSSYYDVAQERLKEIMREYKGKILTAASAYADDDNYGMAVEKLKEASVVIEDDNEIQNKLSEYSEIIKLNALKKAEEYANANEYGSAVTVLKEAINDIGEDDQLQFKYSTYSGLYVTNVTTQVDEYVKDKKYNEAISILNYALDILPSNSMLKAKLESVEGIKPVSLSNVIMVNQSGWTWNEGMPFDTLGNDYSGTNNFVIADYNAYGEFRVNKKYNKLTGCIAPYKDKSDDFDWYVQIFADDKLMYTSKIVTRKTDKISFNI